MQTIEENDNLSLIEKVTRLKKAKAGTWYDGWRPYCINCSSGERMQQRTYGFRCSTCFNLIGWDLHRLKESPINFILKKAG